MEKILRENLKVISNNKVSRNYFKIVLGSAQIIRFIRPGQFLEIRLSKGYQPLLRRPFSAHSKQHKQIEILYEAVGQGTEFLAQKKQGEYLDTIGPLGNGFDYRSPLAANRSAILIAGGMGVAPLIFLAERLVHSSQFPPQADQPTAGTVHSRPLVLIGAKTKNQILCEKEFAKLGCDVKISTDDGSRGFKGKVTDLLDKILASRFRLHASGSKKHAACSVQRAALIYACGPHPMLKEVSRICQGYNIQAQISLEEHMACGIGACLGCVVNTKEGYKRVCKDGPVFNADEIIW